MRNSDCVWFGVDDLSERAGMTFVSGYFPGKASQRQIELTKQSVGMLYESIRTKSKIPFLARKGDVDSGD